MDGEGGGFEVRVRWCERSMFAKALEILDLGKTSIPRLIILATIKRSSKPR